MAMKPCRECKTEISTSAKQCPKCGAPVKTGLGFLGWTAVVIVVLAVVGALGNARKGAESPTTDSPTTVATAPSTGTFYVPPADPEWEATKNLGAAEPVAAPSPWSYEEQASAMDNAKTKIACTSSTNQVSLDFPYKNTGASLCIRKSPKSGLDAFVALDGEGQILCRTYEGCSVRVRFDTRPARAFPAVDAADHSTNIVFIKSVPKLITELKKSSKAVVELEFYQNGVQSLEFNTEQFEWK